MSWTQEDKDDFIIMGIFLFLGLVFGGGIIGMWVDSSWRNDLIERDMAYYSTDPKSGGEYFVYGPAPVNKERLEYKKKSLKRNLPNLMKNCRKLRLQMFLTKIDEGGNLLWNQYECKHCKDLGFPHEVIDVPGPYTGRDSCWGSGLSTTLRKCTHCGYSDGPWVSSDIVWGF